MGFLAVGAVALGALAISQSGKKQQTTINIPGPSAEETALAASNTQLSQAQLAAFQETSKRQAELFELQRPALERQALEQKILNEIYTPEEQAGLIKQELERTKRLGPIQDELLNLQLEQIRRGGKASPEELATIEDVITKQIASGKTDIDRFMDFGLERIREELAPSRGLRPTDTPIVDRGFQLAEEGGRMFGGLEKGLRAAGAQAALDYPLARMKTVSEVSGFQQNMNQAIRDFQLQLKQQADMNRQQLALAGTGSSSSLIGSAGNPFALQGSLTASRYGASGQTVRQTGMSLGEYGSILGGLGSMMAASDLRFKEKIKLRGFHKSGVGFYDFYFIGDSIPKVGVIAQEVALEHPEAVVKGSNGYLYVDYSKLGERHARI